jgi:mannose/cellobiose epimerase-like protein (N-acyl-D-glucosamine 2-epimerase family)
MPADPLYHDQGWLETRIRRLLGFYHPQCLDEATGGYIAQFNEETGEIYDRDPKHLVATCRFVVNFSVAATLREGEQYAVAAERGVNFLLNHHRDDEHDGFHWLLEGTVPVDSTRVCYGHAFVLLALARAADAGVGPTEDDIEDIARLLNNRFRDPEYGLYRSEYTADWSTATDYRGQNANMHLCEAMLAAYETTGSDRYLRRAVELARLVTIDLTAATDGLIWEHYTPAWEHDFNYNRGDPEHTFRPWGYQPGHQIEWAKLLGILARHADDEWLLPRAAELFDAAITHGWDDEHGGLYYSIDLDRDPLVTDKYSWEIAEAIGAAAVLFQQTGRDRYRDWYDRFWTYADQWLVNSDAHNWYTKVSRQNDPIPRTEGIAVEPSYHPIGACLESIRSLC